MSTAKLNRFFYFYCSMFCTWLPKKINYQYDIAILILVILDYLILHLSLLYIYCENVEREILAVRPLRDHIGLNVNAIFGARYTDLRGLSSWILLRKVWSLQDRATKNSTRCPLRPPCTPTRRIIYYSLLVLQDKLWHCLISRSNLRYNRIFKKISLRKRKWMISISWACNLLFVVELGYITTGNHIQNLRHQLCYSVPILKHIIITCLIGSNQLTEADSILEAWKLVSKYLWKFCQYNISLINYLRKNRFGKKQCNIRYAAW